MGLHPDVQREKDSAFLWWKEAGSALKTQGSTVNKVRDTPDFSAAVGAMQYKSGKHEIDFYVNRQSDGYVYVGVSVPNIALDRTFCRRDARDQVWYYFGCGYTNALRNGWDDVVSKEVGGSEMKIPKMHSCDRIRAHLDLEQGELSFSIFRLDDGGWKPMPGKITGIKGPVVAACCLQERSSVSLGEACKVSLKPQATGGDGDGGKKRNDRYAHVQSKLLAELRSNPPPMLRSQTDTDLYNPAMSRRELLTRARTERQLETTHVHHNFVTHSPTSDSAESGTPASPPQPVLRSASERGMHPPQLNLNLNHNHFLDFDMAIGRGYLSPRLSTTPRTLGRRATMLQVDPEVYGPAPPLTAHGARLAVLERSARTRQTLQSKMRDAIRLQHIRPDNRTYLSMKMMATLQRHQAQQSFNNGRQPAALPPQATSAEKQAMALLCVGEQRRQGEAAPVGLIERRDGGFLLVPRQLQGEGRKVASGGRQLSPGAKGQPAARSPPASSSPLRASSLNIFATKEELRSSLPTSLPRSWE